MKKRNLAFIDVETTGRDPLRHEIIEIGGIIAKQIPRAGRGPALEVIDEFEFKIKPEHLETAESEALRINGYNAADWLFAADLPQVIKAVAPKVAEASMVAQNVTFDWSFLNQAFAKVGLPNPMHYHKIDLLSLAFAKLYHDERAQHFSLRNLAEYFDLKNDNAHTALADIRVTFEIYKRLLEI